VLRCVPAEAAPRKGEDGIDPTGAILQAERVSGARGQAQGDKEVVARCRCAEKRGTKRVLSGRVGDLAPPERDADTRLDAIPKWPGLSDILFEQPKLGSTGDEF